jgi:diguanylate cyclase (GGDEF)-like protein/PAS domain S-box-containing protein
MSIPPTLPASDAPATSISQTLLEYQAILENASVGIVFTRHGKILHCNPTFAQIFGWPHDELVGQPGAGFYLSLADHARMHSLATPVLKQGGRLDHEMSMRRKDGSKVHCHFRIKAINPKNPADGIIWIVEDIGDRKAAEAALQELLLRQDAILENASVGIIFTHNRKIIHANPRADAIYGWAPGTLLGQQTDILLKDQHDYASFSRAVGPVLGSGGLLDIEWSITRKDGSSICLRHMARALPSTDGGHNTIWILEDVTEKKSAQAALTQAHDELENRVHERTEELAQTNARLLLEIAERRHAEQQIEFLAYHDPLTGLPNRLLLQDRMQQAMAHAQRTTTRLALLFLDLDNFKKINDSLGHATGDALLKEVASRLRECVRDADTISRQGGDEFVILLSDLLDPDAAVPVLTNIMERLQEPFYADGTELSTSVSIGAALFPQDGPDFETLRKKADMAMYRAKEAGRNTYRFFNEEMNTEAVEHLVIRNGLRRALERGEFTLHYQPQIDLASAAVIGAEALIRWNHPEFGLVPPGRFIPIAEDSGLIVPIGEWVIHEACRQAMAWKTSGLPDLTIAVNLSAVQFRRSQVEQTVISALQQSGLDPSLLELELTESILIQNVEQVLATVKRLKLLGVKLSIDDFGTGYSSLSYLKRFDIDKLKIDQSFIRDLATDPDDAAIVRAIIQMAHSLNLKTIAEGVENPGMLQRLRIFRCDEAQGYHFARPMPADEFARYLSTTLLAQASSNRP